jgi:hypothetical protein
MTELTTRPSVRSTRLAATIAFATSDTAAIAAVRYRFEARLSGKDSAVWISPTATMSWPQPSRSAVTPSAETAGSLEISTAATR